MVGISPKVAGLDGQLSENPVEDDRETYVRVKR
jgi:hypothetical protein